MWRCTSSFPLTTMAPSKLSPELPLEILCEITKFLPLKGLQTLSLASRLTRSLAIPFIFGHLRYTGDLPLKLNNIHQARRDVKKAIKCVVCFIIMLMTISLIHHLAKKTRTIQLCNYWKKWKPCHIPISGNLSKFTGSPCRGSSTCISLSVYFLHPTYLSSRTRSWYWLRASWRTPYSRPRWPGETRHILGCIWQHEWARKLASSSVWVHSAHTYHASGTQG